MMRNPCLHPAFATVLLMTGFIAGCLNLGPGTERFPRLYVLSAMATDADRVSMNWQGSRDTGVGPLTFPGYLNRPQIVTRSGENEVLTAPLANWAEPLDQNVMRVLVDNIATLAGTDAVYRYPWRAGYAPRFQLQLSIDRFEAVRSGDAMLIVRWEWLGRDGAPLMARQRTQLRETVPGSGADGDVVAAMSGLLYQFSRIAVVQLARLLP
jgi:uncharacterized lipoprotein YmbA